MASLADLQAGAASASSPPPPASPAPSAMPASSSASPAPAAMDPVAAAQAQDYLDYRDWLSQQSGGPDIGGSIAVYGPDTAARYRTNPPKPPPGFVDPTTLIPSQQAGASQPTGFLQPASSGPSGAPHTWSDPSVGVKVAAMQQALAAPSSTASQPATPPPGKISGKVANLAAGANDAIPGTLGLPADVVAGAVNLVPRAINAAAGTSIPTIQNPVGGSDWWKSAMGTIGADPRNVASSGLGDNLARGVGAGIAGAVMPLGAARTIAGPVAATVPLLEGATATTAPASIAATMAAPSLGSTALSGAGSGAGGVLAERMVPDKYAPLANVAGQVLGGAAPAGLLAAGAMGARGAEAAAQAIRGPIGIRSPLAPASMRAAPVLDAAGAPVLDDAGTPLVASPSQLDMARDRLAGSAGMPATDAAASIPSPAAAQLVPGSTPSLAAATGNRGFAGLEGTLRGGNAAPFEAAANTNTAARTAAVTNLADPASQGAAAGRYVQQHLQQTEARVRARLEAASMQMGGRQAGGSEATARQAYGTELRARAKAIDDAGNGRVSRLFQALDPDGTSRLLSTPLRDAGKSLRAEMIPGSGAEFTDREEHWINAAEHMPRIVSYASLQQTRRGLGEAIRTARTDGTPSEVRRLSILKAAVDRSTAEATARAAAVEAPHVVGGHLPPGSSTLGRLAAHAANDPAPPTPSAGTTVYTPSGRAVDVRYRVVEAGSLRGSHTASMEPNPTYPAEMQPRDRTRAASEVQVQRIAGHLQPERLGASASAGEGAPIVGSDGAVESGNARYLGIRRAYAANGPVAARYRDWLGRQGFDTTGMREPVLVRERTTELTPADRVRFAQEANAGPGLAMSAGERAKVDAGRLSDDVLGLYHAGDVTSASNRDFVRSFARNVLEKGEEGAFLTKDGTLSLEGVQRVRNALLHRAYGDGGLVAALAESGDEGIRSFGAALTDAAGSMARLRSGVAAGEIDPGVDITRNLVEAAQAVRQARAAGASLRDFVGQRDAFGGGVSAKTEDVLKLAYGSDLAERVSRGKLAEYLTTYAARAEQQSNQARLFGQNMTADELLRAVGNDGGPVARQADGHASVLADQRAGYADGGNEARGSGAGSSREEADSRGAGGVGRGAEDEAESLDPDLARQHNEAIAAKREHEQRMQGAPRRILAPGKAGAEYNVADSAAAGAFFRSGKGSPEDAQSLVRMLGSRDAALQAIGDYAAHDLRATAERPDGTFDSRKLTDWLAGHREALDVFPELRQRFATVQRAQAEMDALAARRKAVNGDLGDHTAGTVDAAGHWLPGTRGASVAGTYLAGSPDRLPSLERAATASLDADAVRGGAVDPAAHASWLQRHQSALSATSSEYRAAVATPEGAARTVTEAWTEKAELVRQQQDSAAAIYLDSAGDLQDPAKAMDKLMATDNPAVVGANLRRFMQGDQAATLGLQRNAVDWVVGKAVKGLEGGDREVDGKALLNLLGNDKVARGLGAILQPAQMAALRDVAADLARETAAVRAGKADASAAAAGEKPSMLALMMGGELGGEMLGHVLGVASHGVSFALKVGTMGASGAVARARAAGQANVDRVLSAAVLNPELARVLLLRPVPAGRPAVLNRLQGMLANLSADGGLRTHGGGSGGR